MFILLTVLILFLSALTLLIVRFFAPEFRYIWLIAVVGALLGWMSVFVWQARMPIVTQFLVWEPSSLFIESPAFVADGMAWAFAVSLVTLCLAVIVTAVARNPFPFPVAWAGVLSITAFGVLAVVAANPLTLVLLWAAIDLVELFAQMRFVEDPKLSERVVIAFASRASGILVLLLADMISSANGQRLDFRLAPPQAGLYLVIAAGLRLGVLPLHLPYPSEAAIRRGFGTTLRMISAASSLILLARIPSSSVTFALMPYLLMLVAFAAVYGGWMWLRAPEELAGRPYWLIGMGSLAIASALRANPAGAAAWGCALVLCGASLFLSSEPNRWLARALYVGALGISSLPLSLTATGWMSDGPNSWLSWVSWIPLLVAHAMLIAGFIRHSQRITMRIGNENKPIWAKNIYPIGILLLLATSILLGILGWDGALKVGNLFAGLFVSLLTFSLLWLSPRLRILNPVRAHWVRPDGESRAGLGYQTIWELYRRLRNLSDIFTNTLEGESGIMWTLLFLALFVSFFLRGSP